MCHRSSSYVPNYLRSLFSILKYMNILKLQIAGDLKKAFESGLQICGIEDGQIQWLGDKVQWANYQ